VCSGNSVQQLGATATHASRNECHFGENGEPFSSTLCFCTIEGLVFSSFSCLSWMYGGYEGISRQQRMGRQVPGITVIYDQRTWSSHLMHCMSTVTRYPSYIPALIHAYSVPIPEFQRVSPCDFPLSFLLPVAFFPIFPDP
jgi:hypothetical protein